MNKQQLMFNLTQIGMTEKEAKLYIAMLEKPEISAGDLHRIAGVARSKIYDILEKMLTKGYCQQRVEKTRRYFKAVQPSFLQKSLLQRWEEDFKSMKLASTNALGFLESKFDRIQSADRSLHLIEILRNLDHIRQRYLSLVNGTKEEILTFNRSPYACQDPKVLEGQNVAIRGLTDRGVKARTLHMWEDDAWEWIGPSMMNQGDSGEEIRMTDSLPIKMMVFDRKRVLLALSDIPGESKADFTMVVIEDAGMINSFVFLFQTIWNQAVPLKKWLAQSRKK